VQIRIMLRPSRAVEACDMASKAPGAINWQGRMGDGDVTQAICDRVLSGLS